MHSAKARQHLHESLASLMNVALVEEAPIDASELAFEMMPPGVLEHPNFPRDRD